MFLSTSATFASHLASGELTYEYIGDQTGIGHHYIIRLVLFRDITGVSMPSTANVSYSSPCYSSKVYQLPMVKSGNDSLYDHCYSGTNTRYYEKYEYLDTVIFPGTCSFTLSFSTCCRPSGYTNILGSQGFYLEAQKTTFWENSSTQSDLFFPGVFLTGQDITWGHGITQPDNDSIRIRMINSKESATLQIPFNSGYSIYQPFAYDTAKGLTLNPKTGTVSFTPNMIQFFALAFEVEEYRYDTIYGIWQMMGSRTFEKVANVVGVSPNVSKVKISNSKTLYDCKTKSIVIHTSEPFIGETIDPNSSEFYVTDPNAHLVSIGKVETLPVGSSKSDSIRIYFHDSLNVNGVYHLYNMIGVDGNIGVGTCSQGFEYDTLSFSVKGCSGIGLEEQAEEANSVVLYPNPANNEIHLKSLLHLRLEDVRVFDAQGRTLLVPKKQTRLGLTMDISHLEQGIYFINTGDQTQSTLKFIKH